MGAICAIVYLLVVIVFVPFPFLKDIVAATSGGGNRDVVIELQQVETGRLLHKFPHSKVCDLNSCPFCLCRAYGLISLRLTFLPFYPFR
jgi:UDP-N-acetylglucosamine--dolichyl-phosphate N-acetylglucosaminephosphotransferase